jgi:2-dehydro-3-deoxyphosphogluconate aldolase / (4S)-4-hydroxy-2-oxoglutarate aldolase
MSSKKPVLMEIMRVGILPLYYCHSQTVSMDVARVLYKAGVRVIEYTNRGVAALENFTAMKMILSEELPMLHLGIGTVKSKEEAEAFVRAGADFIVAPIVNPEVAAVAKEAGLPWIPGCMTPTEIYQAQQLGAPVIKLFPANILKPEFLRSIFTVFMGQKFIPTGGMGIDEKIIRDWYQSGVAAVGIGNKLVTNEIMAEGAYDLLYEKTMELLEIVKKVRKEMKLGS